MRRHDVAYYRERAKTERRLAVASEKEDVAAIHDELARRYEALAEQADLRPNFANGGGAGRAYRPTGYGA